jgi:type II secretory pathway pseudopilin PulG
MRKQGGFTYVGVIVLVAIIGLVGAATLRVGTLMQRAAAESELLEIGATFSDALRSYAAATPKGQPTHPQSLGDLLKDPRFPGIKRHLRKFYHDPITGSAEWGLVTAGDGKGGILGFYSLSDSAPLKISNFDARFPGFDNRKKISDWKFTATGQGVIVTGSSPAPMPANPAPISPPPPRQPMPEPQEPPKPPAEQPPADAPAPGADESKDPPDQKDPQEPPDPAPDTPAPAPAPIPAPLPAPAPVNPVKPPIRQ